MGRRRESTSVLGKGKAGVKWLVPVVSGKVMEWAVVVETNVCHS